MFLAPFLAELVSSSTPPQAWLYPTVLPIFAAIYGVSALVIRELALRSKSGGVGVVVLGLAFGIVNEGIAAHSLFDPRWPDAGVLGSYGRFAGVNWLWATWIVPFHAVWSIAFPILIVGRIWPESAGRRWLSNRTLAWLVPVPLVVAAVVGVLASPYPLPAGDWAGMLVATGLLGWIGLRWAPRWELARPWARLRGSPTWGFALGFLFFVIGQIGTWQTVHLGPYAEVGGALLLVTYAAYAFWAGTLAPDADGDRARFAFALGGIGFYVVLSPVAELALGRIGLVPIDVTVLTLLVLLYRRRARGASDAGTRVSGPQE